MSQQGEECASSTPAVSKKIVWQAKPKPPVAVQKPLPLQVTNGDDDDIGSHHTLRQKKEIGFDRHLREPADDGHRKKLMTTVADINARIRAQRTRSLPETTRTQINLPGSTAVELELHVMPFHSFIVRPSIATRISNAFQLN